MMTSAEATVARATRPDAANESIAERGPAGPLSAAQLAQYRRDGFLVVDEPVVPAGELDWFRDVLLALFEARARSDDGVLLDLGGGKPGTARSPQILNPSTYEPRLKRLGYRDAAFALARQLLGPEVTLCGEHAVLKPPRTGAPTPWHQDEAFRDPNYDHRQVSIWIAITEVTATSGPVVYLPGSHREEVREHRLLGGDRNALTVECVAAVDDRRAVPCPVRAGGLLIHDVRTLHRALPNTSDAIRLGYILIFEAPPVPRTTARTFAWRAQLESNRRRQRLLGLLRGGFIVEPWRKLRVELASGRKLSELTPRRILKWLGLLFKGSV